jgi:hypothetical protein
VLCATPLYYLRVPIYILMDECRRIGVDVKDFPLTSTRGGTDRGSSSRRVLSMGEQISFVALPISFAVMAGAVFYPSLCLVAGWLAQSWSTAHPAADYLHGIEVGGVLMTMIVAGLCVLRAVFRPTIGAVVVAVAVVIGAWVARLVVIPKLSDPYGGPPYLPEFTFTWVIVALLVSAALCGLFFCAGRWALPHWIFPVVVAAGSGWTAWWLHKHQSWWSTPSQRHSWAQLTTHGYPWSAPTAGVSLFTALATGALLMALLGIAIDRS